MDTGIPKIWEENSEVPLWTADSEIWLFQNNKKFKISQANLQQVFGFSSRQPHDNFTTLLYSGAACIFLFLYGSYVIMSDVSPFATDSTITTFSRIMSMG